MEEQTSLNNIITVVFHNERYDERERMLLSIFFTSIQKSLSANHISKQRKPLVGSCHTF